METLKRVHAEELARGRRRVWERVGRRVEIRAVLFEFNRRRRELEYEREMYLQRVELIEAALGPCLPDEQTFGRVWTS